MNELRIFALSVLIALSFVGNYVYVIATEPKCSKFDFEEKVLEKLVILDHETEMKVKDLERKFTMIQEELANVKEELRVRESRSIYVRWGRTTCAGSEAGLIYRGYTAGGKINKGSGANLLCLPENPSWGNYDDSANTQRGHIYGTEIDDSPKAASEKIFGYEVNQHDLPCAVCETKYPITHMFPGRHNCFNGWKLQYAGYLISDYHAHSSIKNYECLDSSPEAVPKGNTNDNQSVLYLVEAKCGSLPCPPYVEGREIACVVCSR